MKALKFLAAGVLAGVMLASCGGSAPKMEGITKGQVDSASYAVGTHFGRMIKDSNMEGLNYSQVEKGMMDIINGKKPMIDPYQAGNIINAYTMGRIRYTVSDTTETVICLCMTMVYQCSVNIEFCISIFCEVVVTKFCNQCIPSARYKAYCLCPTLSCCAS